MNFARKEVSAIIQVHPLFSISFQLFGFRSLDITGLHFVNLSHSSPYQSSVSSISFYFDQGVKRVYREKVPDYFRVSRLFLPPPYIASSMRTLKSIWNLHGASCYEGLFRPLELKWLLNRCFMHYERSHYRWHLWS